MRACIKEKAKWVQLCENHILDDQSTSEDDVYPLIRDYMFSLDRGSSYLVAKAVSTSVSTPCPAHVVISKSVMVSSTEDCLTKAHKVVQLGLKNLWCKQLSLLSHTWDDTSCTLPQCLFYVCVYKREWTDRSLLASVPLAGCADNHGHLVYRLL